MISRRTFLSGTAGVGLALAAPKLGLYASESQDYSPASVGKPSDEQLLALDVYTELIGLPGSWQAVQEGLHPTTPERVVILTEAEKNCDQTGLVVQIIDTLKAYYRLSECPESWANLTAIQDDLGLPIFCGGVTLPAECQRSGTATTNSFVDWWLFLLPDGYGRHDAGALDERQPQMMLLRVHQQPPTLDHSVEGLFMAHLIYRIHLRQAKWSQAATMDPMSVARLVNEEIVLSWKSLPYCKIMQRRDA